MSNVLNTEHLEHTTSDLNTSTIDSVPPKRRPGRPAKYAKEERGEKYKEAKQIWINENKQHLKDLRKEYYTAHQQEIIQYTKDYNERSRYALQILNALYDEKESLNSISPELRTKISYLIEHRKKVCI